jgi:hypothetical protein
MAIIRSRQTRREMLSGMSKLAGATLLSRRLLLAGNEASAAHYAPKLSVEVYIWIQHLASKKKTLAEGVDCCVDVHRAYRGGQEVMTFIRETGHRLVELHLRNSRQGAWTEDFGPGDIDYQKVADYLRGITFKGYLVVELAYEKDTQITRSVEEDLRLSRQYAEKIFALPASA